MRNILSYQYGTYFSGKEINDFIDYHLNNKTSHTKEAKRLMKHFIFKDKNTYISYQGRMRDGSPWAIMFRRVR